MANLRMLASWSENLEQILKFRIFQIEETMSMSRVKGTGGGPGSKNYFSNI